MQKFPKASPSQSPAFAPSRLNAALRAALLSTGAATFLTMPALAQETSTAQSEASTAKLEAVIVTSQRRVESLPAVPASVGVVSGSKLEILHINNLANLQEISPSLIVSQSATPSTGNFTMRGIGTSVTDSAYEQSVGVYIDGVYRGRPGAALQDLMDIQQVEVLRGPQSTLFGRNNTAGAINITTTRPNLVKFGFNGDLTFGNYGDRQARASVNAPLVTDTLALKVSVAKSERDGVIDAPNLPEGKINSRDRQS